MCSKNKVFIVAGSPAIDGFNQETRCQPKREMYVYIDQVIGPIVYLLLTDINAGYDAL
jgi:hypothetical protein